MKLLSLLLICLHISLFASNEVEMLRTFDEEIHPEMSAIWETFLSNFDQREIKSWHFSKTTGQFIFELNEPLKLWIPSSKAEDPKKGSILILGEKNRSGQTVVEGVLHKSNRTIEFKRGFCIYCNYKIGFANMPITATVYSFQYKDTQNVIMEAGKSGMSQKRSKTAQDFLRAWKHPQGVVHGDHTAYLKNIVAS